jgi:SAM-dependent methyltransferase
MSERSPENPTLLDETADVRAAVREKYGSIAAGKDPGCCGDSGCCDTGDPIPLMQQIGYSPEEAAAVPEGANLGLGCGNPLGLAEARPGETVLDLGAGAGIDCFLAARAVGPRGHVIGVDMTPPMVERARANARRHGYSQVGFRLGEIEHLPVADRSVDLVISNCVINLSPDKPQVFREAHRVLRPGGRLVVSDLVLIRPLAPEHRRSLELYVGCVAGAAERQDYLEAIRAAGFQDVEVLRESRYEVGAVSLPEGSAERAAFAAVVSVTVRARRPS